MLIPFIPPSEVPYRYLQLRIDSVVTGVGRNVFELKYMVGATEYPQSIGAMTTNTAPIPLVATGTSQQAGQNYFEAFDGDDTTDTSYWAATDGEAFPVYLTIDLGAGNEIRPDAVKMTNVNSGNAMPASGSFRGSNTGSFAGEEETLKTFSGLTWAAPETKTITF